MKNFRISILRAIFLVLFPTLLFAQSEYPVWAYGMKILPFDVLYPFETGFARINGEVETSDEQIRDRLTEIKNDGADALIFYIDNEQSYETFVDDAGFAQTLNKIQTLVNEAHSHNLKVICYVNGLEVIAVGARTDLAMPTLARNNSDWLQKDILGEQMVWYTTEETEWIPGDSEDAWASPLSPWRDFFKQRIASLATTGLDGVYIDATFLPGVDSFGIKWASSDVYFQNEFQDSYNLSIPSSVDWNSESWRKFIFFRHEVIRDYLGELAEVARANGMVPFFESSSCDLRSGTYLANDVQFTISGDIACSPEIEPEGDFLAAFRMSKATRDANQDFPMWFLGWPENADYARREFSVTLCHSGNYYPTAEVDYPANAFTFIDLLRVPVLSKRVPFQNTVLIYPMRSKDYTFEDEATFNSYINAFTELIQKHIPFRILPLGTMTAEDLSGINYVVLAGAESISDEEFNLLKNKTVALVGENGTKDKWGTARSQPLEFNNTVDISNLERNLPFIVQAPVSSFIEYYVDATDENHFFIFSYNNEKSGEIRIESADAITGNLYEIDNGVSELNGTNIAVSINDYLSVIELHLSGASAIGENENLTENFELNCYPNPLSKSADGNGILNIHYTIPMSETQNPDKSGQVFASLTLKIYDVLGRKIKTIVDRAQPSGEYSLKYDASKLSAGIYFFGLEYGNKSLTKKVLFTK